MPTLNISPTNPSITLGQTQKFTAEILDPIPESVTTYKWFVDGELDDTSSTETFSLTPNTIGEKIIKVESTSTRSEEPVVLTDETTLTIKKKTMNPIVNIEVDKSTTEVGNTVKFTVKIEDAPEGSTTKYLWDSGETEESINVVTTEVGNLKKECTVTISHSDYDTKEINASSTVDVTAKTMDDVILDIVITPDKVKVGEDYEVEAIVTGGPSDKSIKYKWNTGQESSKFTITAKDIGIIKYECTITVDAKDYLSFSTKSSHSVSIEKAPEEPEIACRYIHPLDHRKSAYLWVGYWVLEEIEKAVEEDIDWKKPNNTDLKYKCDLQTLAVMLETYPNIEVQESRNGYILSKEDIENGVIY